MWKWLVAVVLVLVVWLVVLPLRQVTRFIAPELTSTEISGSIWKGRLANAEWRGVALGDLEVALDPRALLDGDVRLDFKRGASELTGRLGTGNGRHVAERLNGRVRVPLKSSLATDLDVTLENAEISIDAAGQCQKASGQVATRLSGIPGLGTSPVLSGVVRCDDGALLLPLRSSDDTVGLDVRLWADRRYRADVTVKTTSMVVRLAMTAAGFTTAPDEARRTFEGRL